MRMKLVIDGFCIKSKYPYHCREGENKGLQAWKIAFPASIQAKHSDTLLLFLVL